MKWFLFLLLAGCSGAHNNSTSDAHGTGDSGGGNLYKGRPLESYIRKPHDLPAYRTYIASMVKVTEQHNVGWVLTGLFEHKTWYFVPGPLLGLPADRIGSVVPTNQVALQDFDNVWIDTDLFDRMGEEDQAKILIHEILMGIKLLRLDSYKHGCLLDSPNEVLEICEGASVLPRGKPSDLSPQDYDEIRATVDEVFRSTNMNSDDWEDLLGRENFSDTEAGLVFRQAGHERREKLSTVAGWIKSAVALGYVPQHGYDIEHLLLQHPGLWDKPPYKPVDWLPHENCSVDMSFNGNAFSFSIKMGDKEIHSTTTGLGQDIILERDNFFGEALWRTSIDYFELGKKYKLGDRLYSIELGLKDDSRLDYVQVIEMACANEDCSSWRNPKGGLHYTCASAGKLVYR